MGKLYTNGNAEIWVFSKDHLPAHFHIITPDTEALVYLHTMQVQVGNLRGSKAKAALAWAKANRVKIVAEWNRLNPRFPAT